MQNRNFSRREFLKSIALSATATGLYGCNLSFEKSRVSRKKPNIIFIMADDLGYGHPGCYGQEKIRTPNLDRMSAEGMRFTQAYAGCSVCAPSRSVLMTGLHGGHTPVRGNSGGIALHKEDITVAEVLKTADYKTGLFGKWELGARDTSEIPNKQGFDEFLGYLHQIHGHFYYPQYVWKNRHKYYLPGNADGGEAQYTAACPRGFSERIQMKVPGSPIYG